jgi:hypothetical protein
MCELEKHGFVGIELKSDFSNVCDVLPATREIARLGQPQQIQGVPWRFLDRSLTRDDLFVGWNRGALHNEGTYGKIFKGYRILVRRVPGSAPDGSDGFLMASTEAQEVALKLTLPTTGHTHMTEQDVKAHVSEALLHVLAWNIMQRTTLPWAVPRPYEMFGDYDVAAAGWRNMSLCMDFVRGRTLHAYLERTWLRTTPRENAICFLEVIAQMACILYALQRFLRLNHRDVKINNIMVRRRATGREAATLRLGGSVDLTTQLELTLIDFGFACVGCPPPRPPMSAFHASSYFTPHEMCCKVGRDLAQLIFCIHCYFPLHQFLPRELYREVRSWLQIVWAGGMVDGLHGFEKDGTPRETHLMGIPEYHQGVYEFLRRAEVDVPACEPVLLFNKCVRLKGRYL